MGRLLVKNGYLKDMCYDEVGLCVQNTHVIIGLKFSIIERVCMTG